MATGFKAPGLRLLPVAFLAMLAATAVPAADKKGNYAVWGVGGTSCNQFNQARLQGGDQKFRSYISGYFTYYNAATPETINIAGSLNMLEVLGLLDEICSESPVMGFNDAMTALTQQLHPDRQRIQGRGR